MSNFLSLLTTNELVIVPKKLIKFAGLHSTVFLSELIAIQEKSKLILLPVTLQEIKERTGLSRNYQENAREFLVKKGLIKIIFKGQPPKLYYRINLKKVLPLIQEEKP